MNIQKIQELADLICQQEERPLVPIRINPRIKRLLGRAYWHNDTAKDFIELSYDTIQQQDEYVLSILIHELSHIFTKQGHTDQFFKTSNRIHNNFGLREDRQYKPYHGIVYSGNTEIKYTPKAKPTIDVNDIPL